jgi:hypothetical protein
MKTFKIQRQTTKYKCNLGSYDVILHSQTLQQTFLVSSVEPASKQMDRNKLYTVRFEVFMAALIYTVVFRVIIP